MEQPFQKQVVDRAKSTVAFWLQGRFRIIRWHDQKLPIFSQRDYEADAWRGFLISKFDNKISPKNLQYLRILK